MSPSPRRALIGIVFGVAPLLSAYGQQSGLPAEREIPSGQAANCSMVQVPTDAAVNMSHGAYLFIYPKTLGSAYSGCQMVWDEQGQIIFVLRFQAGKLARMQAREEEGASRRLECRYRNEALLRGESEDCPDYEALATGFHTVSADTLKVPNERDPRRK
ncbi:hypothetical protein ACFJIX_17350 [Roseateles sp. UC29_93]|uniref:hypothetical protein n=1 Tax=Roseateles sp. UC29_93 TaxID=3350177 RepID=UPI00366E49A0